MDPAAKAGFSEWGVTGKATPSEARRAKSEGGVFGEGTASPLPTSYGVWGSAMSSAVFLYFECSGWFFL